MKNEEWRFNVKMVWEDGVKAPSYPFMGGVGGDYESPKEAALAAVRSVLCDEEIKLQKIEINNNRFIINLYFLNSNLDIKKTLTSLKKVKKEEKVFFQITLTIENESKSLFLPSGEYERLNNEVIEALEYAFER